MNLPLIHSLKSKGNRPECNVYLKFQLSWKQSQAYQAIKIHNVVCKGSGLRCGLVQITRDRLLWGSHMYRWETWFWAAQWAQPLSSWEVFASQWQCRQSQGIVSASCSGTLLAAEDLRADTLKQLDLEEQKGTPFLLLKFHTNTGGKAACAQPMFHQFLRLKNSDCPVLVTLTYVKYAFDHLLIIFW